ncbi:MAG: formate/nitrite transporter family protein [Promicromonosporaceae bacterium]|nr:formate/nitrite transporter family protein [Promicromonosporaceae bacterium]
MATAPAAPFDAEFDGERTDAVEAEVPATGERVLLTESSVSPYDIVDSMIATGAYKASRPRHMIVVRAILASFIFGAVTTFVGVVVTQTGQPWVGALIFPTALVIVILLGLELVTSSMGLVPLAWWRHEVTGWRVWRAIGFALIGHILGCALAAAVFWATITQFGQNLDAPVAVWMRELAEHKTIEYLAMGLPAGLGLVFLKAILCNWLVSLGGVMGMTSRTTGGKIAAIWLPIMVFFGLGWEHSVVNLFVIPAGMMVGAEITLADWWFLNEIPVLLGNLIGAALLTGLGIWMAHHPGLPWHEEDPRLFHY